MSFSGAAAGSTAPAAREQIDEFNSSDEENEAAPDKMEVDNDHDRKFLSLNVETVLSTLAQLI